MSAPAAACRVARLEGAHVEQAAAVLSFAFSYESEYSWSRPLGMPNDRFVGWLRFIYIPQRVDASPASLVALCDGEETLAGVLTLEDMNAKEDAAEPEAAADAPADAPPAGMDVIEAILAECKAQFFAALREYEGAQAGGSGAALAAVEHSALHTFGYFAFLGVAEAARRRGVGAALVARGVEQLRGDGYAFGVAFCTSHKSAALFKREGFSRWGGVSYQAFAMPDGRHPFASLPRDECSVMVRDLRV